MVIVENIRVYPKTNETDSKPTEKILFRFRNESLKRIERKKWLTTIHWSFSSSTHTGRALQCLRFGFRKKPKQRNYNENINAQCNSTKYLNSE